jgi:Gpi18-like mannosyltransferase
MVKVLWKDEHLFPAVIWFASRLFVWTAMLVVAPNIPSTSEGVVRSFGWGVFDAWDSVHYRSIATSGYEFVNDGQQHNLAFFPLFPLIIRGLMLAGLPFEIAGTLVNNLAFLGALYCLYFWILEQLGTKVARWAIMVVAWCPLSLFGTVIYTEGLYLFLSTAALQSFDRKRYGQTAFWGAMATATRPTGIALIVAFLLASWKERRPPIAYLTCLGTASGLLLFSLYCAIYFGDPIAFIHAQKGWRPSFGFDWLSWWSMLLEITTGASNWQDIQLKNLLHLLLFVIIAGVGCSMWFSCQKFCSRRMAYFFYLGVTFSLILADNQFINDLLNVGMVLGGGYFLWRSRQKCSYVTSFYGFCGIALLLVSGSVLSLSRLAYGIIPLSIGIAVALASYPRWGYLSLGLFSILLAKLAINFAQDVWIG